MYDALDFTKIDASLYQRPVGRRLMLQFNVVVLLSQDYFVYSY